MKICPKCGTENRDTAKFCNGCGTDFGFKEERETNGDIEKREESLENEPIANNALLGSKATQKDVVNTENDFNNRELKSYQAIEQNRLPSKVKNKRLLLGAVIIVLVCLLLFSIMSGKKSNIQTDNNSFDKSHEDSTDTTQVAKDDNYSQEEFGNLKFDIPKGWYKENVNGESSSKGIKFYNSTDSDDFCTMIYISMMDVDYSLGVNRIINTGLSNYNNDSIKETVIDGVKFKYVDYTVEKGDVRYQRLYIFPCSENEVGTLMIAWKHDGSEELQLLEQIVKGITFSQKLPDTIATY